MALKLFQHLVREPELKGAWEKISAETLHIFKQGSAFEGFTKTYTPKNDDGDKLPSESKEVVTTVPARLAWTAKHLAPLLDYELTRDTANSGAKGDIEIDGVTLAKNVPTTTLLSLEKRLQTLRELYDKMPSLDMAKKWTPSDAQKELFTHSTISFRSAKKTVPVILYAATDKHPAQVKDVTEDVQIGQFNQTTFSGAVQPGRKAELLARIDRLLEAVKQARMRANEVEAHPLAIGKALMDYIHAS